MSESEKEGTTVVSRGVDGLDHDDDDDDDDDDGDDDGGGSRGSTERKKKKQKRQRRGCGCGGDFSKVKVVALIPYTKAKKLLIRRRTDSNKKPSSSSSSSSCSANADGSAKRVNDSCVCFKRPSTLESPAESITSDPNDPNFTFDMLRALIENNDFFSKECNPHLDATRSSFSSDNSWAK